MEPPDAELVELGNGYVDVTWYDVLETGAGVSSEVLRDVLDPITAKIMRDPVRAQDGVTYERASIEHWFATRGICSPTFFTEDDTPLPIGGTLTPNDERRLAIERLLEHTRWGGGALAPSSSGDELDEEGFAEARPPSPSTHPPVELEPVTFDKWGEQTQARSVARRAPEQTISPSAARSVNNLSKELNRIFLPLDSLLELQALTGLQPPKIVVVGNESSGKSTLLESLIKFPLFPRGRQFCTRMAIHVQLRRPTSSDDQPRVRMSVWNIDDLAAGGTTFMPWEEIPIASGFLYVGQKMRELADTSSRAAGMSGVVTDKAIVLEVIHPEVPVLDFVDLPGRVQVDVPEYPGKRAAIQEIYNKQVAMDNADKGCTSIYLVVVPAPTATGERPNNNEALQFVMDNGLEDRAIGVFTKSDGSVPVQLRQYITGESVTVLDDDGKPLPPLSVAEIGGVNLAGGWISTMLKMPASPNPLYFTRHGLERIKKMENDERAFYGSPAPGSEVLRDLYDRGLAGVPALAVRLMERYHEHVRTSWLDGALRRLCGRELKLRYERALLGWNDDAEAIERTKACVNDAAKEAHESFIRDVVLSELDKKLAALLDTWGGRTAFPPSVELDAHMEGLSLKVKAMVHGTIGDRLLSTFLNGIRCQLETKVGYEVEVGAAVEAIEVDRLAIGGVVCQAVAGSTKWKVVREGGTQIQVEESQIRISIDHVFERTTLPPAWEPFRPWLMAKIASPTVQLAPFPGYCDAVVAATRLVCQGALLRIEEATAQIVDRAFSADSSYLRYKVRSVGKKVEVSWQWRPDPGGRPFDSLIDTINAAIIRYLPTPRMLADACSDAGLRLSAFEESLESVEARNEMEQRRTRVNQAARQLVSALDNDPDYPLEQRLRILRANPWVAPADIETLHPEVQQFLFARVRIDDLNERSDLNGRVGVATQWLADRGRFKVYLQTCGDKAAEQVTVRPNKLTVVDYHVAPSLVEDDEPPPLETERARARGGD